MKLKAVYILLTAGLLVVITMIIMFIEIRNNFESILLDNYTTILNLKADKLELENKLLEYIIEGE
jgi:hypothetical protein